MGSESLSHKFTVKDPTYKEDSSAKNANGKSSSQHSMSHTSGTQPVSVSNGPTSSSSSIFKHKPRAYSKYTKLLKLHKRQLLHIETTLNAIESLSKSANNDRQTMLTSIRQRVDQLNENLEHLSNTPSEQDHEHFDPIKHDIDQIVNDLKSYKTTHSHPDSTNTIDHLVVGFPLDVSENEDDIDTTKL